MRKMLDINKLTKKDNNLLDGRINNIIIQKSGTISTAPYENWKPGFTMSLSTEGLDVLQTRELLKLASKELDIQFELERHNKLAEAISDGNIGYSMINGVAYAWVSSICSFDIIWKIPEFELNQYACRGKLAEALFCHLLDGNKYPTKAEMEDFFKSKDLHEDYAIMTKGNLGLTLDNLPIEKQYENVKSHITNIRYQVEIKNDEYLYKGRADIFCDWDGVPGCFDIKATASLPNYNQVVLYAVCEPGTKQIGYIPLGKSDTKRGYQLIKMTTDIPGEFKNAIKKRNRFYKRFGF